MPLLRHGLGRLDPVAGFDQAAIRRLDPVGEVEGQAGEPAQVVDHGFAAEHRPLTEAPLSPAPRMGFTRFLQSFVGLLAIAHRVSRRPGGEAQVVVDEATLGLDAGVDDAEGRRDVGLILRRHVAETTVGLRYPCERLRHVAAGLGDGRELKLLLQRQDRDLGDGLHVGPDAPAGQLIHRQLAHISPALVRDRHPMHAGGRASSAIVDAEAGSATRGPPGTVPLRRLGVPGD